MGNAIHSRLLPLLCWLSLAGLAAAQPATDQPLANSEVDLAAGGRLIDIGGSREKLEEYGRIDPGLVLDNLRLQLEGATSPNYLELNAQQLREDAEAFHLTVGRRGKARFALDYESIPHYFARGLFLWGGFGEPRLRIPDLVQSQLQANEQTAAERGGGTVRLALDPNTDTTGEDAIQQSIVRDLYSSAPSVVFGLQRRRVGANLELNLTPSLRAWARASNEDRSGTRVVGTGTYERWNVGSGLAHLADRFMTAGAELAEPINRRTQAVSVGVGLQRRSWLADVEYTFTDFRNYTDVLQWDNPFRVSDASQVANLDRGRFAVGQLTLVPGSFSHDLTASGGLDLPLQGRLSASVGLGVVRQEEPFASYTLNSAILATNVPGTPPAPELALPEEDLGGQVRTVFGTLHATVRPLEMLALGARYRFYQYDGRSRVIEFPGYAAFGESDWRTVKNDRNAPVVNEVFDWRRQDAVLDADLALTRMITVRAALDWSGWTYGHLRLDGMDEYGAGIGLSARPFRFTQVRADYRYSFRDIEGYLQGRTPENPEATGLINYNWAERNRHLASARVQFSPTSLVSVGLLCRLTSDDYGGQTEGDREVDQFRFGRTDARRLSGSVDLTFTPMEQLSLSLNYTREYSRERMSSAAKDDGAKGEVFFGFADDYAPANYWGSELSEGVDTVGVNVTAQPFPGRLVLGAGYNFSLSELNVDTVNQDGVQDLTLANAVANDWPTIRNRLHEFNVDLAYPVLPNVRAGVRYLYTRYDLADFAWDLMEPYMAGLSVENTTRFVFTDATYSGYQAHLGTVYVSGSF